jgi:hypothetical protein
MLIGFLLCLGPELAASPRWAAACRSKTSRRTPAAATSAVNDTFADVTPMARRPRALIAARPVMTPFKITAARQMHDTHEHTVDVIAAAHDVSRASVCRALAKPVVGVERLRAG